MCDLCTSSDVLFAIEGSSTRVIVFLFRMILLVLFVECSTSGGLLLLFSQCLYRVETESGSHTLYSRNLLLFSFCAACSVIEAVSVTVVASFTPKTSLCNLATFSSEVSVHPGLAPLPELGPCPLEPFPVLNLRFFNWVGSTREVQSPLEGGTTIHSSLWVFVGTGLSDFPSDPEISFSLVDVVVPFWDVAVGRLGPKSSSSLLLLLLLLLCELASPLTSSAVGLLGGGRVGPIVRTLFADESGELDVDLHPTKERESATPCSSSARDLRFPPFEGEPAGTIEGSEAELIPTTISKTSPRGL